MHSSFIVKIVHKMLPFVVFVISLSSLTSSLNIPNFISPCSELTPECLKEATQKAIPSFVNGIPEWGIDSLDPFHVSHLKLSLSGALKINFVNGTSRGFRRTIVDSASLEGDTFKMKLRLVNWSVKGQYKSSGRMFALQINGEGDISIRCENIKVLLTMRWGTKIAEDGKKHIQIKEYSAKHSFDGKVSYQATNLFQGNPHISKAIVVFMNDNWRLVAEEFGNPIVDFAVKSVMKNIQLLFDAVPLEELIKAPVQF